MLVQQQRNAFKQGQPKCGEKHVRLKLRFFSRIMDHWERYRRPDEQFAAPCPTTLGHRTTVLGSLCPRSHCDPAGGSAGVGQREMPRGVAVKPTPRSGGGHIEVQNAATIMDQREKDVKDLKTDRGHREEVDGHIRVGYDRARTAKRQIPTNPTVPAY